MSNKTRSLLAIYMAMTMGSNLRNLFNRYAVDNIRRCHRCRANLYAPTRRCPSCRAKIR